MDNVLHAGTPVAITVGEVDETWAIPVEDYGSANVAQKPRAAMDR